jgi:hypothetical protein
MENPAFYIAAAVYSSAQASMQVQEITARHLINLVGSYLPLTISWSSQLTSDQQKYFSDMMKSTPNDPASVTQTAVDYANYQQDDSAMSKQTGALGNLIESQKSAASLQTNNLAQEYRSMSSLAGYTQVYCLLLRLKQ